MPLSADSSKRSRTSTTHTQIAMDDWRHDSVQIVLKLTWRFTTLTLKCQSATVYTSSYLSCSSSLTCAYLVDFRLTSIRRNPISVRRTCLMWTYTWSSAAVVCTQGSWRFTVLPDDFLVNVDSRCCVWIASPSSILVDQVPSPSQSHNIVFWSISRHVCRTVDKY